MNVWAKTESSPTVCTAKRCHLCSRACRQTQTASFQTHGLNSLCLSPFGFYSEGECVRVCYSVTVFDPAWRGTFNMLYKQHSLPLSVAISSVFPFSLCCLLFFFFILLALPPDFPSHQVCLSTKPFCIHSPFTLIAACVRGCVFLRTGHGCLSVLVCQTFIFPHRVS